MGAAAPPCDCCRGESWEYEFTLSGLDLGRCASCGLHYVRQLPAADVRMTELEESLFAGGATSMSDAERHQAGESARAAEFRRYVDLLERHAPRGRWLDVGCGTGSMLLAARRNGVDIDGIELTPDRRDRAATITGCRVFGDPIEAIRADYGSYAAISMINVFSHLVSPSSTFRRVRELLAPEGVLLVHTGEAGVGARPAHQSNWLLGDHLFFLGEGTIGEYASRTGFVVDHHERRWQPDVETSYERFATPAGTRAKTLAKSAVLHTPGALALLRRIVMWRQRDNPMYTATMVLRRT